MYKKLLLNFKLLIISITRLYSFLLYNSITDLTYIVEIEICLEVFSLILNFLLHSKQIQKKTNNPSN